MDTDKRKVKLVGWGILAVIMTTTLEVASYVSIKFLEKKHPWLIWNHADNWDPDVSIHEYLEQRHPVLGWPTMERLTGTEFNEFGARRSSYFSSQHTPCVSTYGDSFTWSDEVSYEYAWPNQLSKLLDCNVSNFGIWGYGVDQAVMRHDINIEDVAPVTILTILPYDTYRNLNQMRALIQGNNDPYTLKPRYIFDGKKLEFEPLPKPNEKDFLNLTTYPSKVLNHEFFLPGTKYGPIPVTFPYSGFWWDLASNTAFRNRVELTFNGKPHWSKFFEPNHPSQSLELMVAMVSRFHNNSLQRNQQPLVLLLPDNRSIDFFNSTGKWEYQHLEDQLKEHGINVVNLGKRLLDKINQPNICSILARPSECDGHFNRDGYLILANIAHEILERDPKLYARLRKQ